MSRIKHIVITRFLSRQFSGGNVLDNDVIQERMLFLINNTMQTLNNQTNMDFEFLLLVNPNLQDEQLKEISQQIRKQDVKYPISIIKHDNNIYSSYIERQWKNVDYLILTRIDDDDFVTKYAVQDTRDVINDFPDSVQIVACGYKKGYKFIDGSSVINDYESKHTNGHIALFQSMIYNTNAMEFNNHVLPYRMKHTDLVSVMQMFGVSYKLIHFNRERSFIYYRHPSADSYCRNSRNTNPIMISEEMKKMFLDEFGFNCGGQK